MVDKQLARRLAKLYTNAAKYDQKGYRLIDEDPARPMDWQDVVVLWACALAVAATLAITLWP
jgi:hypothetical protein